MNGEKKRRGEERSERKEILLTSIASCVLVHVRTSSAASECATMVCALLLQFSSVQFRLAPNVEVANML